MEAAICDHGKMPTFRRQPKFAAGNWREKCTGLQAGGGGPQLSCLPFRRQPVVMPARLPKKAAQQSMTILYGSSAVTFHRLQRLLQSPAAFGSRLPHANLQSLFFCFLFVGHKPALRLALI